MGARSITLWYGVCDECGAEDGDSRLTEQEARDRMWPDDKGRELCWDCLLRDCTFTREGTCTAHPEGCSDCSCGTPLHWEPRSPFRPSSSAQSDGGSE